MSRNLRTRGVDFADAATAFEDVRLDDDILDWFREQVHAAGGGSYQTLINAALRRHIQSEREPLEDTLRRVIREEIPDYGNRGTRRSRGRE